MRSYGDWVLGTKVFIRDFLVLTTFLALMASPYMLALIWDEGTGGFHVKETMLMVSAWSLGMALTVKHRGGFPEVCLHDDVLKMNYRKNGRANEEKCWREELYSFVSALVISAIVAVVLGLLCTTLIQFFILHDEIGPKQAMPITAWSLFAIFLMDFSIGSFRRLFNLVNGHGTMLAKELFLHENVLPYMNVDMLKWDGRKELSDIVEESLNRRWYREASHFSKMGYKIDSSRLKRMIPELYETTVLKGSEDEWLDILEIAKRNDMSVEACYGEVLKSYFRCILKYGTRKGGGNDVQRMEKEMEPLLPWLNKNTLDEKILALSPMLSAFILSTETRQGGVKNRRRI